MLAHKYPRIPGLIISCMQIYPYRFWEKSNLNFWPCLRGKHNRFLSFIQVLTKKSCVDNGLITMFTSRHLASYHTTVPQITSTGYTISLQSRHPFRRNRSKTVCSLAGNAQVGILSGCIFRLAHIYIHHQTTHLRRVCTRYIIYRGKKRLESHF